MLYNQFIDHTLLKAIATNQDIEQLCNEAKQHQFFSVCINPVWINEAVKHLHNSNVNICTVIGFPLGADTTLTKINAIKNALDLGANEIDTVINIGYVKSGLWHLIEQEIKELKKACPHNILKIILETCYLSQQEKIKTSQICIANGADFIKTSTGFGTGGAIIEDVMLMKKIAGDKGVKASGGIRNLEDMKKMIDAGATRIGTSNGVSIINQTSNNLNAY